MGERTDKNLTLERIDVNGNYEPSNCKWIPRSHQARNRTNALRLTYDGETLSVKEWSAKLGINFHTLYSRIITKGWTTAEALEKVPSQRPSSTKAS